MQGLPVGQGQQDMQAAAPGMAFGMPYGHVSMAYSYHPYNTPPPAMLYSQVRLPTLKPSNCAALHILKSISQFFVRLVLPCILVGQCF